MLTKILELQVWEDDKLVSKYENVFVCESCQARIVEENAYTLETEPETKDGSCEYFAHV